MTKLMVSIREENFRLLSLEATERGITIQELLRAVIVPDWMRTSKSISLQQNSSRLEQSQSSQKRERELSPFITPSASRDLRGP